jgi:hypothetical protein
MNFAAALSPAFPLLRRRREAALEPASSLASPPGRFNRYLLNIDFEASGGEQWSSVGGGESVAEAIAAAREALPLGHDWDVARWNHLYGG